jgi:hypothetical protein
MATRQNRLIQSLVSGPVMSNLPSSGRRMAISAARSALRAGATSRQARNAAVTAVGGPSDGGG